jgi:hypothetical protein
MQNITSKNIQLLTYLFLNSWFIKREINIWQIYIYFYTDKMATSSDVLCSTRGSTVGKTTRTRVLMGRAYVAHVSFCFEETLYRT